MNENIMEITGVITAKTQWDLDHHEPVLYVDEKNLLDFIFKYFGTEMKNEMFHANQELPGKFRITVERIE